MNAEEIAQILTNAARYAASGKAGAWDDIAQEVLAAVKSITDRLDALERVAKGK